ncbi:MAG: hypothetical protein J6C99_09270 [Lachnospiraceae bacterium]|nr:hypothetical protein [Lachnospiraceae bacterium]
MRACVLCGYTCTSQWNLKTHMK